MVFKFKKSEHKCQNYYATRKKSVFFFGTLKIFKNVLVSFTTYVHPSTLTTRELPEGFSLHLIWKSFAQLLSSCILHMKSYMRFNVNLSGVICYTLIEAKNVWYKAEKY